jgi:DNA-binding transcriptional LysR family regulator
MSTLRQMAYWLAVVEEGSFTRAAARMHVSQPSLSQQIRTLETELGGDLLERLPRSVRLTPAGKAFLPHARTAVNSAARAVRSANSALQLETGELEISTVRSIAVGLLPDLISTWRERFPGTFVRLHEFTHRKLSEDSVREGLSDMGIGPPPRDWRGPVCRFGWEEFKVVLPSNDPLAARTAVALDELSQREWVMFDEENGLYDIVIQACAASARSPFKPRHAVLTSQVEAAARLASAGVGPALVPENTIPDGLKASVLSVEPPLGRELTVYGRSEWTPLAAAFIEVMRSAAWSEPPLDATLIA